MMNGSLERNLKLNNDQLIKRIRLSDVMINFSMLLLTTSTKIYHGLKRIRVSSLYKNSSEPGNPILERERETRSYYFKIRFLCSITHELFSKDLSQTDCKTTTPT